MKQNIAKLSCVAIETIDYIGMKLKTKEEVHEVIRILYESSLLEQQALQQINNDKKIH